MPGCDLDFGNDLEASTQNLLIMLHKLKTKMRRKDVINHVSFASEERKNEGFMDGVS